MYKCVFNLLKPRQKNPQINTLFSRWRSNTFLLRVSQDCLLLPELCKLISLKFHRTGSKMKPYYKAEPELTNYKAICFYQWYKHTNTNIYLYIK